MARTPGSGRQAGTPNRLTTQFKDAVRTVYEEIGGHAAFAAWARENPTEFYRIASKLIPAEVNGKDKRDEKLVVVIEPNRVKLRAMAEARQLEMQRANQSLPGAIEYVPPPPRLSAGTGAS